ncbi:MAG TPA: hypothetical protein VFU30_10830, partial [Gaiellaceae bacterium]|nr:hypothetical protein [Gaiellaceae bacterium]
MLRIWKPPIGFGSGVFLLSSLGRFAAGPEDTSKGRTERVGEHFLPKPPAGCGRKITLWREPP